MMKSNNLEDLGGMLTVEEGGAAQETSGEAIIIPLYPKTENTGKEQSLKLKEFREQTRKNPELSEKEKQEIKEKIEESGIETPRKRIDYLNYKQKPPSPKFLKNLDDFFSNNIYRGDPEDAYKPFTKAQPVDPALKEIGSGFVKQGNRIYSPESRFMKQPNIKNEVIEKEPETHSFTDWLKKTHEDKEVERKEETLEKKEELKNQLVQTRKEYFNAYKKEFGEENYSWADRGLIQFGDFLGIWKKDTGMSDETKKLQQEYKNLRREVVINETKKPEEVRERLLKKGLSEEEATRVSERYLKSVVAYNLIFKERQEIGRMQDETFSSKQTEIFKKGLRAYAKLPRLAKLSISAGIFGMAGGAFATVGGAATYAGMKIGRGLASGFIGGQAGQLYERTTKKNYETDKKELEQAKASLAKEFTSQKIKTEEYEKELELIEGREKKLERNRLITKGAISLVGGFTAGSLSNIEHVGSGSVDVHHGQEGVMGSGGATEHMGQTGATGETNDQNLVNQKPEVGQPKNLSDTQEYMRSKIGPTETGVHTATEIHETQIHASGRGAIDSFAKLKEQLEKEYPDPSKAPSDVQEILKTDATKLAIKHGFYNPNQANESAHLSKDAVFGIDKSGRFFYEGHAGHVTTNFHGHFDNTDHHTPLHENIHQNNPTSFEDTHTETKTLDQIIHEGSQKNAPSLEEIAGNHTTTPTFEEVKNNLDYTEQDSDTFSDKTESLFKNKIDRFFGKGFIFRDHGLDSMEWKNVSSMKADEILKILKEPHEDFQPKYGRLMNYVEKIEQQSGLSALNKDETLEHFMKRAIEQIHEHGKIKIYSNDDMYN